MASAAPGSLTGKTVSDGRRSVCGAAAFAIFRRRSGDDGRDRPTWVAPGSEPGAVRIHR